MCVDGLEEMLVQVYAKNSVIRMINRHAYANSLKTPFLLEAAEAQLILEQYEKYRSLINSDVQNFHEIYSQIRKICTKSESFLFKVKFIL